MTPEQEAEFVDILKQFHDADEDGDQEATEEATEQMWQHLAENYETSPDLLALGRAHECEARFDWKGAEDAYREAFALSEGKPAMQSRVLGKLSALFSLIGDKERALDMAVESLDLARGVDFPIPLIEGLAKECTLRLRRGELYVARELLREELEFCAANPQVTQASWPRVMLRRARLHIQCGDLEAATSDLHEAGAPLEARRQWTFMAGFQVGLAEWWETKALLCAAQNDHMGEVEALRKAVEYCVVVSQAPQLEGPYKFNALAGTWFKLAQALRAVNPAEAEGSFARSAEIRRNIGLSPFEE